MKVDLERQNVGLHDLFERPSQVITVDANIIIPSARKISGINSFEFTKYRDIFLEPLFECFPNLAVHEAVYREFVKDEVKNYIDGKLSLNPPKLILHKDGDLNSIESTFRNTYEAKMAPYTRYVPSINNSDDRGEVKSLSYIAVKNLLYFVAHDSVALSLIKEAESKNTGLDNLIAIHMYEILFYMVRLDVSSKKDLRNLYRYLYRLTASEKLENPEWNVFLNKMDGLY